MASQFAYVKSMQRNRPKTKGSKVIICGFGKIAKIREEFELVEHYSLLTGELPERVEAKHGYIHLVEKNGKEYFGRYGSEITRLISAEHNILTRSAEVQHVNA
jgi:hypothetical protein